MSVDLIFCCSSFQAERKRKTKGISMRSSLSKPVVTVTVSCCCTLFRFSERRRRLGADIEARKSKSHVHVSSSHQSFPDLFLLPKYKQQWQRFAKVSILQFFQKCKFDSDSKRTRPFQVSTNLFSVLSACRTENREQQ